MDRRSTMSGRCYHLVRLIKSVNLRFIVSFTIALIAALLMIELTMFIHGYVYGKSLPNYLLLILLFVFSVVFLLMSFNFVVLIVKEGLSALIKTGMVSPVGFAIIYMLALPACIYFLYKIQNEQKIQQFGVITSAYIMDKKANEGADGGSSYFVIYRFADGHETITQRAEVYQSAWKKMIIGSRLRVKYLPNNPRISIPDGYFSSWNAYKGLVFINAIFSILFIYSLWAAFLKEQKKIP